MATAGATGVTAGLKTWAAQRLAGLLQMPAQDCAEIVDNILLYDDEAELKNFLCAFADSTAEYKVNSFVDDLFERRFGAPAGGGKAAGKAPGRGEGGGKASGRGDGGEGRGRGRGAPGRGQPRSEGGRGRGGGRGGTARDEEGDFPRLLMPMQPRDKADKRLLVIDAASGRHSILTNCLNCGKVVTEEEGWGPCLFCGNPLEKGDSFGVRHGDERGYLEPAGGPVANSEKFNKSFEKAKETKDRLLSYDRDAKKRTKVYDDATDWYSESVNPWLSEKQREDAIRHASEEERQRREERRRIHAKIDIFGRTVIDATAEVEAERKAKEKNNFQEWTEGVQDKQRLLGVMEESRSVGNTSSMSADSRQLYDKLRASLHAVGKQAQGKQSSWSTNNEEDGVADKKHKPRWDASIDVQGRVEDEFSRVSMSDFGASGSNTAARMLPVEESPYGDAEDTGQCLSMHQPWASLLVHGFKRAEGRGWSSNHRGRLWIHAGGQPVDESEVRRLEQTYRELYEAHGVPVPPMPSEGAGYPTSALLGCVDMEQCWTQEEYAQVLKDTPSMPQEQNDNAFIFWCLRPRRLVVPVKMGGDHKIWRLPGVQMRAAQRGLQPVRWPAPADGEASLASPALPARPAGGSGGATASGSGSADAAARADDVGAVASTDGAPPPPPPRREPPRLDLWPAEAPAERLEVVARDSEADRSVVVLQNGFVHLPSFVPRDVQQRIVDTLREVGRSPQGFFVENFDSVKVTSGVTRMYLGTHWNAAAQRWEKTRGNLDGAAAPEIPKMLLDVYADAVQRANRELKMPQHKKRKILPFPTGAAPGLAVVNYYAPGASMQAHQDRTESQASIAAGLPVLGICLGDACDFVYGDGPSTGKPPKTVRMESGDVYLFGGESRLMWHGVSKVLPSTAPPSLRLLPGRLSVTLRPA
eukprot:TRINITY_DN16878_c1_g4_i1.p1 TRINITY_DN16878_c1_g4~~TRINITY_DN16878_c1_g4_i1.p1  ORF type:complete len:925 (-),score=217.01 TRINITY_DN16878_c1_g4_i1:188-2962(-)